MRSAEVTLTPATREEERKRDGGRLPAVARLADITEDEALEMGPLLRNTAEAVRDLTEASQVYVCLWSHGPVHIHYVVQPALAETIAEFGVYGPRMQAAMFARGGSVDPGGAAAFAARARSWFSHRA